MADALVKLLCVMIRDFREAKQADIASSNKINAGASIVLSKIRFFINVGRTERSVQDHHQNMGRSSTPTKASIQYKIYETKGKSVDVAASQSLYNLRVVILGHSILLAIIFCRFFDKSGKPLQWKLDCLPSARGCSLARCGGRWPWACACARQ